MLIVGLTGSIGMGKSTVAGWLAERGIPVNDSDAVVHSLYAAGGAAVSAVGALVPEAVVDGAVDRVALGQALRRDPSLFPKLEAIVHPLVRSAQADFMRQAKADGAALVCLDIPLLFETHGDARVDVVIVVHAPLDVQRARVLARPNMTEGALNAILAKQMPSDEKVRHADFVIDTSLPLHETEMLVDQLARDLSERSGSAYRRIWMDDGA
ncbi:MAG: dephospho-CoA kinase [Pseudomonadota bacterium]